MVLTIDDLDIPRKRSVSPVRPRPPLVPQADSDDSSTLPGEGEDTFEVAVVGEDSKVAMTIDDIPRNRSLSPVRLTAAVNDTTTGSRTPTREDSKVPMTIDEMDIPRKPSGMSTSSSRARSPSRHLMGNNNNSSTVSPKTIDDMNIPKKPSTLRGASPRRTGGTSPRRHRSTPVRRQRKDDGSSPLTPISIDEMDIWGTSPPRARSRSPTPREAKNDNSSAPMRIDDMDIPRKPSTMTPKKRSNNTTRRARSPPTREAKDGDRSTLPEMPMTSTMTTKKRNNSPHRPQPPPPPQREVKDDGSSTLPEMPMATASSSSPRLGSTNPTRKQIVVPSPKRGVVPNIRQLKDDDGSALPGGEGEGTVEVPKLEDKHDDIGGSQPTNNTNKKADREPVSFALSGGPLFKQNSMKFMESRKFMENFHDITQDDVSDLDESNRSDGANYLGSEDFMNFPALRANNTGLSAQTLALRRSQLEADDDSSTLGGDGDTLKGGEVKPAKKRIFNLRGNRRGSSFLGNKKSPKKSPDGSSTLEGVGDTLEAAEEGPKKHRVFRLRGNQPASSRLLGGFGKSNKDDDGHQADSSDDNDEEETDFFNLAPMTAETLARRRQQLEKGDDSSTLGGEEDTLEAAGTKPQRGFLPKMVSFSLGGGGSGPLTAEALATRRKQLEEEDDSSTIGGEGDTREPVEAKPKRGMSKMVSFSLRGGLGSAMSKLSPKRKKSTFGGLKEGVSDDEDDGGLGNMAVPLVPPSPLQVSRRHRPKRRNKRGGMVTTPSSMNLGEVMSNPFDISESGQFGSSQFGSEDIDRPTMRQSISVSSVISASELSQETDLHRALADDESTLDQLKYLLHNEPASASIHDKEGKLPLHIVAENEFLHQNLGGALDDFILEDLIERNRRALITPSYAGDFPFIPAIREWVDNINEVAETQIPDFSMFHSERPKKDPKPLGLRKMSLFGGAKPPPEPDDDSSELGLELPAANDVESQKKKEEIMRDLAEHLIPWNVFIDDLALWSIDMLSILIEREPLKAMWTIKIVDTVASIPCFLKTVLLIDDDEQRKHVLQSRLLREVMLHEKSMGPWLVYLITSDDEVAQDRAVMYLQLMTVIEAQVSQQSRKTFSSRISGAFQTADNKLMERKNRVYTRAAELPDIIPAFMQFNTENFSKCSTTSIVQFILDKKLFEPTSLAVILFDGFFLTMAVILYTLCSNEVFKLISNMRYSPMVFLAVNQTAYDMCEDGTLSRDDHTCMYYNEKEANGESFNLGSVSLFRPYFDCDMECQVCRGMNDFGGTESTGSSIIRYSEGEEIEEETIFSCYAIGQRYAIDTFLIFCAMALTFNCLYFLSRSLAAWVRVPRKYLAVQFFMVFTLVDTLSIIFPVVMVGIFVTFIYQTDRFTLLEEGIYVPLKLYEIWMQEAEFLSFGSAACVGFLYLKILMYFKVLNQYTATFIFALGEVVKDIFWFFWIMVVILFGFSQMFYTTLSCKEGFCRGDIGQLESGYTYFDDSLVKTYSILLGEFDLDQFNSPFTTTLFVLYTFAVVVVVLNFLIAIVGDSYDKSMTKIETHFGRARLMFMVELSAFQSFAKVPFRVKKQNYRRFLLGGNWKGCISYLLISGGLVTGYVILVINKDLVTNSSMAIVTTIGIALGLMILAPFIWKMGVIGFLVYNPFLNPVRKTVGRLLILFFRIILGKSILSERTAKEKKDWGGRMKHIVAAIDEKIRESELMTLSTIAENDEKQQRIIEKMELRMENLEEDVSDMKKMLIKIQTMLEERG